ncbi:NAD(P)-dependent oxidoreductase [Actinomadura macrotermitis]|uniref:NAD(P)-binding domain-containing protein n=1 Tax=Actinomadura macrotermitis TaxID=2585200 RepID=A0A7K0C1E9_9ACTN|nr:NAD(P)H-binding protein [Actinomadura macrotermitis]MQY07220.1 hypothetical protein [Actinomadura macrotermitis]
MKITVFGAAGSVGAQVVTEALSRGHQVTAVVRDPARFAELPPAAAHRAGDAADPAAVAALAAGQDLVVSATRPPDGHEHDLVTAAKSLLTGLAGTPTRLLLVGGAATLTTPNGLRVLDDPQYMPPAYRPIALACAAQHEAAREVPDVDWTYLSPPALLLPGERTGHYRLGTDALLVDAEGVSQISVADLAVAVLDEAEHPRHSRTRFTVAY